MLQQIKHDERDNIEGFVHLLQTKKQKEWYSVNRNESA